MPQNRRKLKTWLKLSIVTFLLLVLVHLALPAVLLVFQVASFTVGDQGWILHWQNNETGSGIQFNLLVLLLIAAVVGLILMLSKTGRKLIS